MGVFDIVRMETRVARMMAFFAGIQDKITDLIPGSIARTKLEAVALEMEQQDYQTYLALKKAIPIAIYRAFNFPLLDATRATGKVTFSAAAPASSDVNIFKGTRVATAPDTDGSEKVYETLSDVVLLTGQSSIDANVACTKPGTSGNTGVGTIVVIKTSIPGIDSVTNPNGITNGEDQETESARATRFQEYVESLKRGTNDAVAYALTTAALTDANGVVTENVKQAKVVTSPLGAAGFADGFIYNGVGDASAELLTLAQQIVDGYTDSNGNLVPGYKAAGCVITVQNAGRVPSDVTMTITGSDGFDKPTIQAQAEAIIDTYFSSLGIGDTLILNEVVERTMAIPGVYDVAISAPGANLTAQTIGTPTFTGSGSNDLSVSGTFVFEGKKTYIVKIDGTGPETITWSENGGVTWEATGVAISAGVPIVLSEGISVTFVAAAGHVLNDQWEIAASNANIITKGTVSVTVI